MTKFLHCASLILLLAALLTWPSSAEAAPYRQSTVHIVQQGETLSGIAARYGVSVEAICAVNGIYNANQISAGVSLTIPSAGSSSGSGASAGTGYGYSSGYDAYPQQSGSSSAYAGSTGSAAGSGAAAGSGYASTPAPSRGTGSCSGTYTVVAGDTLSGIASRCGVAVSVLASANGISAWSFLYIGQRLVISSANTTSNSPTYGTSLNGSYSTSVPSDGPGACPAYLTVRSGDTLSGIAARCGVTVADLMRWNSLTSSSVWVGQTLITTGSEPLPAGRGPAAGSAATYGAPTPTSQTPSATPTPRWGAYATPTPTPHLEPTMRP